MINYKCYIQELITNTIYHYANDIKSNNIGDCNSNCYVAMQTTVNIPQFLKINSNYILLPEAFAQLREGSNIRDYSNDFKTYENNDLGIKFQYPESWKYSDKSGDIIFTPISRGGIFYNKVYL